MLRSTFLALAAALSSSVSFAQSCRLDPIPEPVSACTTCTSPVLVAKAGDDFHAWSYEAGGVTMRLLCYTLQRPSYEGWTGELQRLGGSIWISLPQQLDATAARQRIDLYLHNVLPRPLSVWDGGTSTALWAQLSVTTADLLQGSAYLIRGEDLVLGLRDEGSLRVLDAGGGELLRPCQGQGCLVKARLELVNLDVVADGPHLTTELDPGDRRRVLYTELWDFELAPPAYPQMRTHSYFVRAPSDADSDDDGVADEADNCRTMANADQADADGDGYGQACDVDVTNNRIADDTDLSLLRQAFFSTSEVYDFDGSGRVDFGDLARLRSRFLQPPGPSSLAPFDEF